MARAVQRLVAGGDVAMQISRVTCEMLRPVPIDRVTVRVRTEKRGRKVALMHAQLLARDEVCIDARVALVRAETVLVSAIAHQQADPTTPNPSTFPAFGFPFFSWSEGYHTAVELRLVRGPFGAGTAAMWMRPRIPLVHGETATGAQHAMVCADAGSGVTLGVDITRNTFVNADLTVHLLREPAGPWILLDGATWLNADAGRGLAETRLSDECGLVGRAQQSLVLQQR